MHVLLADALNLEYIQLSLCNTTAVSDGVFISFCGNRAEMIHAVVMDSVLYVYRSSGMYMG